MQQSAIITEQQWINTHRNMNTVPNESVPLIMGWRVIRLRMEEQPPVWSCEYIE